MSFFSSKRRLLFTAAALCIAISLLIAVTVRFDFSGDLDGIYVLSGKDFRLFEVKDIILLGEYDRVLLQVEFRRIIRAFQKKVHRPLSRPYLEHQWHEQSGNGYVMSNFPGGEKLLMAFSRFLDSRGAAPDGLFLGGGLPYENYDDDSPLLNETGMAFFDGGKWLHLWCNANEAIIAGNQLFSPSQWEFLGSKVMLERDNELVIRSNHRIMVFGKAPLQVDRFAFFRAGDAFFVLIIRIRNAGSVPIAYQYIYGDEPWVGNYGSSRGNVGWTADGLSYYEGSIDTSRHTYAGMADYGNPAVPEEHNGPFSGAANFILWLGALRPNVAYFSNTIGSYSDAKRKVPLASPDNRVLFLEWGPRELQPGQSEHIMLALGMAGRDRERGIPAVPRLQLRRENLDFVIQSD